MSDRGLKQLLLALPFAAALVANANAEELVDPTRPSHVAAASDSNTTRAPAWHVESIIVSPGRRLAVVNGRVVGVGDRIGGAKVTEILPYEVRLEYQGEIRRISLVATRVKNPAN